MTAEVPTPTTLSSRLKEGREQAVESARGAIGDLAGIAEGLGLKETASPLRQAQKGLADDTFSIIVMGRFKNGKSTFLNALMGGTTHAVELEGHHGPMVVDDLPCTAILTGVHYSVTPYVKVWSMDKHSQDWTLSQYLHESTLSTDEEESERKFANIKEFEMGFPATLCSAGVVIYDSPGLDDIPARTALTKEATRGCDAAIVVYRSDVIMGQSEMADASSLVAEGTKVFTVINLMNNKVVDEKLRAFVWNKYVRDHLGQGGTYSGQDLGTQDIYFVNAGLARDARYSGDGDGVSRSGVAEFEHRLANYLLGERQQTHLAKFATVASKLALGMEQKIAQRQAAITTDRAHLQEAYKAAQPQLEALRARPQRMPALFARYRMEAQLALTTSLDEMVAQLRRDLPGHLEDVELTSGGVLKVLRQKKMQEETAKAVSDFITARVNGWREEIVPTILDPVLGRLADDVEREAAAIGQQFDQINFDLTGWQPEPGEAGALVGTGERVLAAVAGLLFGDISAAVTGGAGGWRGAVGGISGAIASGVVLTALGVTSAVVFFPLTLAVAAFAGMALGGHGLDRRVKAKAVQTADDQLQRMPADLEPKIVAEVAEEFGRLEQITTEAIAAAIADEVRNIEQTVALNLRDQAERDRNLVSLSDSAAQAGQLRKRLDDAVMVARAS